MQGSRGFGSDTAAGLVMQLRFGPQLVEPGAGRSRLGSPSILRVRERPVARGVCPSNLVREIVSSGRTPPPARMDGI